MAATKAPKKIESKRERFVRLAGSRVNTVLRDLSKVEQLGRKAQYEYTDSDIATIEGTLHTAVDDAINALRAGEPNAPTFSLGA